MKKILLCGVAFGALVVASAASAADASPRPVYKAPAPLPAFSWTGCYAGAHAGWGWGKSDFTQRNVTETLGTTSAFTTTTGVDTSGAVFGGQVGCDWQFAPRFVVGVQGMFAGTDINGLANDASDPNSGGTIGVKTEWLGSVTGRLGVTVFDPTTLLYVKGGGAWARYQVDTHNLANVGCQFQFFFGTTCPAIPGVHHFNVNGWTIGGGFAWAFAQNWSAFVEYNHYDFANKNFFNGSSPVGFFGDGTASNSFDLKSRIETVTVGINYRFLPR
jgi:outer membrane immunogenic protein